MVKNYDILAEKYLEAYRCSQQDDSLLEAIQEIMREPLDGLKLIEAMISKSANDAEIAYIAAGPLEDLFIKYHAALFDQLDKLLRSNIKMRKALTGIWAGENNKAREVLDKLLNKYHLIYGSL